MTDRSGESPAVRPPLLAAREPLPGQAAPPSRPLATSDHITTRHGRHNPAAATNHLPAAAITPSSGLHPSPRSTP
ncbi:hypothetical protein AB0E59_02695 [Lentzea sp. NPDC034063]|uniref:hypothetical protein n=1 Tax=unclassified Lentzea TaxID=2643253 RepID=UPI0033DAFB62